MRAVHAIAAPVGYGSARGSTIGGHGAGLSGNDAISVAAIEAGGSHRVPTDQLLILIALAIAVVSVALVVLLVGPRLSAAGTDSTEGDDGALDHRGPELRSPSPSDVRAEPRSRAGAYDRVVRIVSLVFLATTGIAVAVSNQWPSNTGFIYVLLGLGTLFIVSVQDVLPTSLLGRGRYALEAVGAVLFITVLTTLTGGFESPFFFGYFLLVIGASLWAHGLTPLALALGTALAYLVSVVIVPGTGGLGARQFTWIGFNMLALVLLSYVASVVGREHRRAREAALRLSRFDVLTGINNRNYFFLVLEREMQRAERTGRSLCLLMLDLDELKAVNDQFGHQYGDRLLRAVGEVIRGSVRAVDLPARYGGDEFAVILPETDAAGGYVLAEKLRAGIANLTLRVDGRTIRSSVSIGLATYPEDGATGDQVLSSADAAMYRSKKLGKNRVVGYASTGPGPTGPADGGAVVGPIAPPGGGERRPRTGNPGEAGERERWFPQREARSAIAGREPTPVFGAREARATGLREPLTRAAGAPRRSEWEGARGSGAARGRGEVSGAETPPSTLTEMRHFVTHPAPLQRLRDAQRDEEEDAQPS